MTTRLFFSFSQSVVSALLVALLAAACVKVGTQPAGKQEAATTAAPLSSQPQVSLCLSSTTGGGVHRVRVVVDAVEVSDGGQWVSLVKQPLTLTSEQAAVGALLDRVQLPAGQYQRVRYRITQVIAELGGREMDLKPPPQPVEYPLAKPLTLKGGDSATLVLHWDIAASLRQTPQFTATFSISAQRTQLTTELAFVSCPEINTVYIIRTDQNRICGSWGIPGRPTSIHASKGGNTLYVLASDQAAIVTVELSSGKVRDRIRIPMANRPSFMAIDPEERNAYLLDQTTDFVYRVDLASGSLAAQSRVGERLDFAVFLDDIQQLAVTSGHSQKVFLLDPSSLKIQRAIAAGANPQGVLSYQNTLYVAHGQANIVSVTHFNSGRSLQQPVGLGPTRLLAYDRTIFVANTKGGSISVLRPGQLTGQHELRIGGAPGEMAVSPARSWLYACDSIGNGVAVVDLSSRRLTAMIDLKAKPLDIEVIQ